ncbi:MAG: hypothetical protein IV100_17240 [Myxococcales bacterium]|nr:hypothetical protein [Myxococcales bacterium]
MTIRRTITCLAYCIATLGLSSCESDEAPADSSTDVGAIAGLDFAGDAVVDRSRLTVERVSVSADGWLVVWDVGSDGNPVTPPLAAIAVAKGEKRNLNVTLNSPLTGDRVHLSVHVDDPHDGAFTGTSPSATSGDDPAMRSAAGALVSATVALANLPPLETNLVVIADQTISTKPPKVSAQVTVASFPKYLVIKDATGTVIGSERIWQYGPADYQVSVDLPDGWTTAELTGSLVGADGTQPDLEAPVMDASGKPISVTFTVSAPADENTVVIADQTITSKPPKLLAQVTVASFPKYLVIKNAAGDVLGSERIWQKGPAEYTISVDLPPSWTAVALTGALYAADGNEPDLDAPIKNAAGEPVLVSFLATVPPDNALVVADQTLVSWGYKIKIDSIDVDELPAWVAVYEDNSGAPGDLLGSEAVVTSPKLGLDVDLTRFLGPVETVWVALHADMPADGVLTSADPYLLGSDEKPLLVAIDVTNQACGGAKTKYCDPAKPGVISWLDHCGKPAATTTPCAGEGGYCDDTGPYVACKAPPDPCKGTAGTVCVDDDPYATYFKDLCGVPFKVASKCGATSICDDSDGSATCSLAPSCAGNATTVCDPSDLTRVFWLDHCGQANGNSLPCGAASTCEASSGTAECVVPVDPCGGNAVKVCDPLDVSKVFWEDECGQPTGASFPCGGTSVCNDLSGSAACTVELGCGGNTTKVCNPDDTNNIYWENSCGHLTGSTIPCGSGFVCDDASGSPVCVNSDPCGGNAELACNPDDLENLYWKDHCGAFTGATLPCGAGFKCDESGGTPYCVDANPCAGPSEKFCDPADLSVIKWLDGCGQVKASTLPCGNGYACSDVSGEPTCAPTDVCGGDVATVCNDEDPGNVYWVDGCGELTGNTFPCGVASCDDSSGVAKCVALETCADEKLRVCDPADPLTVLLTNGCGDDLGVFSTCANGKRCAEPTPGTASCACVPTDDVVCFGKHFLYEPSGTKKVDSCGNPNGPVVTECANGEICYYQDQANSADPVCTTSLSDKASPMYHRGCSFIDFVTYKTALEVDCRCRRQAATLNDITSYDMGGNQACQPQDASWADGWTMGEGPHFLHLEHSFNGGGVYSPAHGEIFATKHVTDPNYQGAGMVVGYNIKTGARRIVSGRFPTPESTYEMYGSGYESQRSVGVQLFEPTTLPGAWDLEQGADGKLYVWGSFGGNKEITQVDPDTGARSLVWKQALEGAVGAPVHGQCYSTRPKSTFHGGFIPVQLEDHAFAMGPDGSFYLGFRNDNAEGNGIAKIAPDGSTCTVISRWNGTMGTVGTGASPQYSNLEGFTVHAGKLYATLQIGKVFLSVDIANGKRTVIANPAGSVDSTPGQSTMFWDPTRNLMITGGGVQSYSVTAVNLVTGKRQSLFLTAPGEMIESAPPWETGAHGAIDNANYMGYGAVAMDPVNNDHIYLVIKHGLLKYEMSTGNSYVMSQ